MIVALVVVFEILGLLSAVHAIMSSRTPQGSIAWAVSLVTLPYVSVSTYWVFGCNKFIGPKLSLQRYAAGTGRWGLSRGLSPFVIFVVGRGGRQIAG